MDIHRCRFVAYPTQRISALAFSHPSNPSEPTHPDLRLAVGRESSGEVEIWNPLGGRWVHESTLRGDGTRLVAQLVWTQDVESEERDSTTHYKPGALRLFSVGGSPSITEWDLSNGQPKRESDGNFGDVWCFAAQPPLNPQSEQGTSISFPAQTLVAGCSEGSIVLFSTDENDLRFTRVLVAKPGKNLKVLSVTWRDRETIVAGYENSEIRVIHVPTRRIIRTMTLGKPADSSRVVVWTVKCLPDGTIISGDSAGQLMIWDAKTLSLVQTLHTHQADILEIAFNSKADQMFTVGVDRRTVAYKLITTPGVKSDRWAEASHRRFHGNDVMSIVAHESKDLKVIVTGGVDAALVVNPILEGKKGLHQTLPHLPHQPPICSARRARIFISWWQQEIHIYQVPKRTKSGQSLSNSDYSLLATLQLKGNENVRSASLSEDGRFIIACTTSGVRLFQLRLTSSQGTLTLRSRQVDLPLSLKRFGARLVGISPNSKWLFAIRPDNTVVLCKLLPGLTPKDKPTVHSSITKLIPTSNSTSLSLGSYPSTISAATFSPDSRVFAVGNLSGGISTWVLSGHEDLTPLSPPPKSDKDSDTSMSDYDSNSSDEDESETPTIHNQRWKFTPASTTIPYPSLGSPILLLTFRPPPPSTRHSPSQPNGNVGLHSTRHTPHPISSEQPEPAPQLLVISAEHKLVELDVYTGKLTDWSRRNQRLPLKFTQIRDRVRSCFWDTSLQSEEEIDRERDGNGDGEGRRRQRLWLYGSMFMYMIDMAQDIGEETGIEEEILEAGKRPGKQRTWGTFIYRDILGAGVIGQDQEAVDSAPEVGKKTSTDDDEDVKMEGTEVAMSSRKADEKMQMEVVIVERPMWDAKQPPRFDGGQDWES